MDRARTIVSAHGRPFATFPAAVVVPILNAREEFLLLENPRTRLWQAVSGAVDHGETILDAALREVAEEAGPHIEVRPLGVVHAATFVYDARLERMISVVYLMAHEAGAVAPGDDMHGSRVRWASLPVIAAERLALLPPLDEPWLRSRTLELFRLWLSQPALPLQGDLTRSNERTRDPAGP